MNNQPREKLGSILEQYKPKPSQRFYRRMADAPWNRQPDNRLVPIRRFAYATAALLVIIAILTFSIPTARAAFIAFLGLGRSESNSVPNPAIPAENLVSSQKVAELTQQAGWSILVPSWLPDGYQFSSALYDSKNKMVMLSFTATRQLPGNNPELTTTRMITLVQALRNDVIPLMVAPSTVVENISLHGQPAAYAVGAWENDFSTGQATWNSAYPLQNVFWQVDAVSLCLNSDDQQIRQADLVKMAESTR